MFKRTLCLLTTLLSLSAQAMQGSKEEREPHKDNPIMHIKSPEQKKRKLEKLQLNNLRNSQKALEQQALSNATKWQSSAHNVLQRILDAN